VSRAVKLRAFAAAAVFVSSALALPARAVNTLDQLREQFNHDQGALRLIVLVSPTCPACTGGAQWIEDEILKHYPDLNLRVYAVWYEMYPGDSPKAFPAAKKIMPDARVAHYWDKKKVTGRWFQSNVLSRYKKPIMWDAYYLYGPGVQWSGTLPPPIVWGRTILETRKDLLKQIAVFKEKGNGQLADSDSGASPAKVTTLSPLK